MSFIWPTFTHPNFHPIAISISEAGHSASVFRFQRELATFQTEIGELNSTGLRMLSATTYLDNGVRRWGGVWADGDWDEEFIPGLDLGAFLAQAQLLASTRNLRLIDVDSYVQGGVRLWSGVMRSGDWTEKIVQGLTKTAFQIEMQRLYDAEGLLPLKAVPYLDGGTQKWFGIVRSADWGGGLLMLDRDTETFQQEVQARFDDEGFRLIDATSYVEGGVRLWAGVLRLGVTGQTFAIRKDLNELSDVIYGNGLDLGLSPIHIDVQSE